MAKEGTDIGGGEGWRRRSDGEMIMIDVNLKDGCKRVISSLKHSQSNKSNCLHSSMENVQYQAIYARAILHVACNVSNSNVHVSIRLVKSGKRLDDTDFKHPRCSAKTELAMQD